MTKKEIKRELQKIYTEMASWPGINAKANYKISDDEVKRRELFLIDREELCKLEDTMKFKDKLAEDAHEATDNLIKATLQLYRRVE